MHATVCDYIADLVHNSVEAGATRVALEISTGPEQIAVSVIDNGCGMDDAQVLRAQNPFFSTPGKHDWRRVGLGLPLLQQAADATGGMLAVRSAPGTGTTVTFSFSARHVDAPPLGNLAGTLLTLLALSGSYELTVQRRSPTNTYTVARQALLETLGDLEHALNLALAREFLESLELEIAPQPHAA